MCGDDDTSGLDDLGHLLNTLVAMRSDLTKALDGGENIPEIVKTRMKWADSDLDLAIASLKMFLRLPS